MFKHILLPTDGSPLSEIAIAKGLAFAKTLGAKATGIHVTPKFHLLTYRSEALEESRQQYEADAKQHADQYLTSLARAAEAAGVPCDTVAVTGDHPYEAIIATAEDRHCDLIVMASHGRKGLQAMLLGSETNKVLTHTKIPVLVLRPELGG